MGNGNGSGNGNGGGRIARMVNIEWLQGFAVLGAMAGLNYCLYRSYHGDPPKDVQTVGIIVTFYIAVVNGVLFGRAMAASPAGAASPTTTTTTTTPEGVTTATETPAGKVTMVAKPKAEEVPGT